jgi:hypothetical protein
MKFQNLRFIAEYPDYFKSDNGKSFPFRLYVSDFNEDIKEPGIRLHFGFHKTMIEGIALFLETELYWTNVHWHEDGDFWIYWVSCGFYGTTSPQTLQEIKDQYPQALKKGNQWIDFYLKAWCQCVNFVKKMK